MTQARPRLALFIPSLGGGGTERVLVTLANDFAARGIATDLVLCRASGPFLARVEKDVRLVDLKASHMRWAVLPLARYLRETRPQAMLSALGHANVAAVAARALAGVPTRLVLSERSTLSAALRGGRLWRKGLVPFFMRCSYRHADGIVAISAGVADDLARAIGLPRKRIDVVYNPIDTDRVETLSREEPNHPWLAPGGPPVILGVGRLTAAKDFPTLLRAFARFRAKRAARLMILGEGEDRAALEALARDLGVSEDVAMPGFAANPFAYMRRAALFVLSSRWEGFANVLVEAMACGTPVVSADCPSGPAEILEDGKWGRLVPVGDPAALAQAMAEILGGGERLDARRRAAHFSVAKASAAYLRLLGVKG